MKNRFFLHLFLILNLIPSWNTLIAEPYTDRVVGVKITYFNLPSCADGWNRLTKVQAFKVFIDRFSSNSSDRDQASSRYSLTKYFCFSGKKLNSYGFGSREPIKEHHPLGEPIDFSEDMNFEGLEFQGEMNRPSYFYQYAFTKVKLKSLQELASKSTDLEVLPILARIAAKSFEELSCNKVGACGSSALLELELINQLSNTISASYSGMNTNLSVQDIISDDSLDTSHKVLEILSMVLNTVGNDT